MTRQAVTKHLTLLAAHLIATLKRGREKLRLNSVPIQEIADSWIGEYGRVRWAH